MSLRLGTTLISGVATNTVKNSAQLLEARWFDHTINNQEWLNADTFSWQSGTVYSEAYNHLVADLVGATSSVETVGSYSITVYTATDGHKIVLDDMESTVINIFNESGVAWYYIVDLVNQKFKLPRVNPNKELLTLPLTTVPVYGNGMTLGITNGTNNYGLTTDSAHKFYATTGAYGTNVGVSTSGDSTPNATNHGVTTDPTKSGLIADLSGTTNIYKGHKYLYFYVGEFSKSATEQTAGLNSEMFNQKVDVSSLTECAVVIQSKRPTSADPTWYRKYSDGWVEQGGYAARTGATQNVALLKEMEDANYSIQLSLKHTADSTDGRPPLIRGVTTTDFVANIYTSYAGFYWEVKGFAAE